MRARAALVIAVLAGCGGGDAKPDAQIFEDAPECVVGSQATSTLFLNFAGGTYEPGPDDARTNKAGSIDMMRTLAPWPHANAAELTACVTAALAPFKIAVTEVDPGPTVPHYEVVLTDLFWNTADPTVSTYSSSNCGGTNSNTVLFAFGTAIGTETQNACFDVLLQFAVSSTGLDHVVDCHDFLSNGRCGDKMWTTTPAACGDGTPRNCGCGGSHQISFNKMRDKFGLSCAP